MQTQTEQLDMLLTVKDLAELLSIGVRTVWRKVSQGALPRPVSLSRSIKRWKASDVQAYLDRLSVN